MAHLKTADPVDCLPHTRAIPAKVDLSALADVISRKTDPAILGANASVRGVSIFAAEPIDVFEFALTETAPFEKLEAVLSKYRLNSEKTVTVPGFRSAKIGTVTCFCGGWIGFFGYELGRFIERLPGRAVDDLGWPVIRLAFYDKAIVYDHAAGTFRLTALAIDGQTNTVEEKFRTLTGWLNEAAALSAPDSPPACIDHIHTQSLSPNMSQAEYFQAVDRIKQHIYDGDTYQINFSQRFDTDFRGRPADLFHWQNRYNPSPYAAFLAWDDKAVVSASPELFLQTHGDRIVTEPIKGTRPRNPRLADDTAPNRRAFDDLLTSEKDQAELAMIVDLQRNDLARICIPGSRHVSCLRRIETFPTVYHAVGTIEGRLRSAAGPQRVIEILKAAFPGGSITGAPKIRSMEIIDTLEPTARGVYTGCIGWIGIDFNLCWNIAIRTILIDGVHARVQAGGGIVADSDPAAEWDETLIKARALLAGIRAVS